MLLGTKRERTGDKKGEFSNQFNNVALKKFDAVHLDVLMAAAALELSRFLLFIGAEPLFIESFVLF